MFSETSIGLESFGQGVGTISSYTHVDKYFVMVDLHFVTHHIKYVMTVGCWLSKIIILMLH